MQMRLEHDLETYRHSVQVWAALAPHRKQPGKPPDPPIIPTAPADE